MPYVIESFITWSYIIFTENPNPTGQMFPKNWDKYLMKELLP